jgi:hypothetical protein
MSAERSSLKGIHTDGTDATDEMRFTLSRRHAEKGAPGGAAKPRASGMSAGGNELHYWFWKGKLIPAGAHPARDSAAPRLTAGLASVLSVSSVFGF